MTPAAVRGNLTAVTSLVSSGSTITTATNSYNILGDLISTKDGNGNTTSYDYIDAWSSGKANDVGGSTFAYQTSVSDPLGHLGARAYVATNEFLDQVQEANDLANSRAGTQYTYDALQRPTSTTYADGGNTTITYLTAQSGSPASMSVSTVRDGNLSDNIVSTTVLDGLARQSSTTEANGTVTTTSYDQMGRVSCVTNPHASAQESTDGQTYDALSRSLQVTEPDGSTQMSAYTGSTVDVYDGDQHHWKKQYDAMGRLTTVLEPDPNTNVPTAETDYTYDALSNLLQVDQLGASSRANTSTCLSPTGTATSGSACDRQRAFSYDGLSRLKYSTNPESGTIAYNYDNNSNVHTKTDARGITTTDSYDGLNRLTGKTYTDGTSSVSYHYDSPVQGWNFLDQTSPSWTGVQQNNLIGRLSYENDSSSTIIYGYDAVGRPNLKSECTPSTCGSDHYDMHASYDLAGDIAFADRGLDAARNAQSPNDGYYYGGLTFSYNNAGQIASATSDIVDAAHPQLILGALNYTPLGGVYPVELGEEYAQVSQYDPLGHMTTRYSTNLSGQIVLGDAWTYDSAGNLQTANDSGQGDFSYTYDDLNRITNAGIPPFTEAYSYDAWGNQTSHTTTAGTSYQWNYMPTTQNRATNPGVTYDAAGNMLTDGLHTYTYDAENRVSAVKDQGITYGYDPEGMRVATMTGGTSTAEYLYDLNGNLVTTVNNQGQLTRAILRANRTHWGDYIGVAGPGEVRTEFRLVNQAGTLVANSDTEGNFVEGCLSGPFGDGEDCTGTYDYTETHFVDKLRDQESNNDYFGARYFNSTMGRFMSPDPLLSSGRPENPQTWNRYTYGLNNPLSIIDPTGLYNLVNNCAGDDSKCNKAFAQDAKNLKDGLAALTKAANGLQDGDQKAALQGALKAFGTENDGNNVGVQFGALSGNTAGNTALSVDSSGKFNFTVTFDPSKNQGMFNQAINAAHEGQHVEDISDPRYAANSTTLSPFQLEYRGYQTSSYAGQALGVNSLSYGKDVLWNSSWRAVDTQTLRDKGITQHVTGIPGHPESTPHDPWK